MNLVPALAVEGHFLKAANRGLRISRIGKAPQAVQRKPKRRLLFLHLLCRRIADMVGMRRKNADFKLLRITQNGLVKGSCAFAADDSLLDRCAVLFAVRKHLPDQLIQLLAEILHTDMKKIGPLLFLIIRQFFPETLQRSLGNRLHQLTGRAKCRLIADITDAIVHHLCIGKSEDFLQNQRADNHIDRAARLRGDAGIQRQENLLVDPRKDLFRKPSGP